MRMGGNKTKDGDMGETAKTKGHLRGGVET